MKHTSLLEESTVALKLKSWWDSRKVEICFVLTFLLAFIIAISVGLSDDEAYYWSWSLKPDFSYFDHPPLLAWTLWLTTHIFGKTLFAVRLPALLNFGVCAYLLARWVKRYEIPSRNALAICIGAPLFFVFSWMTLPDVLFLPLGLLSLDFLMNKKFFSCGLTLGLALLSKWHASLLLPGIVLDVALMPVSFRQRMKILFQILGPALILQSPVIYWNWQHHWVSFQYHLRGRFSSRPESFMDIVSHGFGFIIGFFAFCGLAFSYLTFKFLKNPKPWRSWERDDFVLLGLGLPFLVVFGLSALKGETRIYWTGFALFPLSLFLLKNLPHSAHKKFQQIAVGFCFFSIGLLTLCLYTPIGAYGRSLIVAVRPYDIRLSPRGGLIGWQPWVQKEIGEEQPPGEKILFLAADFRLAAQILWNSHLGFDQVSSIDRTHQYSIWPAPDFSRYSKAVIFGDNRRKLERDEWDKVCRTPLLSKEYFKVHLLSRLVKVIEDMECVDLKAKSDQIFGS